MRHSTVTAPIESCNAFSLNSPTSRFCALHLLNGQILYFVVEPKSKTKELYNQACAHLVSQGMLDTDLFGLAVILEGEYLFVDPDYKLSKYAPKNWRSSSTHGLDSSGEPLLAFYFRVQFYLDSPQLLRDETSRHHYYLQLRRNVSERTVAHPYMAEEIVYLLVGLALQADFGDYNETQHKDQYFVLQAYFPQQMVAKGHEVRLYQNAIVVHKANRSLPKAQAEIQFIREASSWDSFTLAHNAHLYRLKRKKHDPNPGDLWLAICTRGIELYEEKSNKPLNGTFLWNYIGKLCFDRKKFEIRSLQPAGERMIYYTNSDEKSKHLLTLCKLTHQFCIAIQSRMNELTRKEEEEKKQYRDLGADFNGKLMDMGYNISGDQRISVISTTSSNTTSGIVSDRVHSLDESEDDLDMEIMINSPPAASIESLALAHLRDSFTKETKKMNKKLTRNSSSLAYQAGSNEVQYETSEPTRKYSLSITPAPTDGSQCSSSCSTVVVTYSRDKSKKQRRESSVIAASNRSHSTSSSLELGYSHTAQNSALSDPASSCLELDYSVQSAHASSGIYTLQSNCETNTVVTTAIAASSETSGLGQSVVEDSEGIRSRSGSIVSASGSFHGDGSDPSDTGHGTPLTAEELSDLIVGRSPKPCRGKYPSIATVSESLDSVADYVTLPPPPMPPSGRISFKPTEETFIIRDDGTSNKDMYSLKSSESMSYVARQGSVSNASSQKCYINSPSNNSRKYFSEEAMLQRQIQFQHLAGGYTSHLLMDTIATQQQQIMRNASKVCADNDLTRVTNNTVPVSTDYPLRQVEETTARIISTKPQINILNAQSTFLPINSFPANYAAPAVLNYSTESFPSSQTSSSVSYPRFSDLSWKNEQCMNVNSVPVVGSNNYLDVRRSGAAFLQHIHEKFPPPPPPILYNRQPPPPPPPPPPRNHYSICSNNTLHQFDQYRQQLYSDVDYVIYPMKDPAISKQEYLDSKEASGHCTQYLSQMSLNSNLAQASTSNAAVFPGSYSLYSPNRKSHALYRSTPNVAAMGVGNCLSPPSYYQRPVTVRYASNQNLNTEYSTNSSLVYLPNAYTPSTSPLYSVATSVHSSSMQSLHQDLSTYGHLLSPFSNRNFTRAYSDDNILNLKNEKPNNLDSKFHKPPPPPPPPPYTLQKNLVCLPERISTSQSLYRTEEKSSAPTFKESARRSNRSGTSKVDGKTETLHSTNVSLDICSLREKSKNLDLPLIAALCNDKSLLKQTNTIEVCKESVKPWINSNTVKEGSNSKSDEFGETKVSFVNTSEVHSQTNSPSKLATPCKTNVDTTPIKNACVNRTDKSLRAITKTNVQRLAKSFDSSRLNPLSCGSQIRSMMETSSKANSVMRHTDTSKVKSINTKLSKSGNSANKLKYSVSQPLQKNSANTPTTSSAAATLISSGMSVSGAKSGPTNNKIKCKTKNKSVDGTLTQNGLKDAK